MATLYIIRGLPGSGKSTLAKRLVHESKHREADMFHMIGGEYLFNMFRVKEAHAWCLAEIVGMMQNEKADCVVSNTFTQRWEYQPYIDEAIKQEYDVMVIDCHGHWESTHNVPSDKLLEMRGRWEHHKE